MSSSRKAGYSIITAIIRIVFIIVAVMVTYHYGEIAYSYGYSVFNQTAVNPSDDRLITFTVTDDESVSDIGNDLKDKGLIKDAKLFRLQEFVSNYHNKIAAGDYQLSSSMTPDEMIQIMAASSDADTGETGELQSNSGELQSETGELQSDSGELQSEAGELQSDSGELTDNGEIYEGTDE